MKILTTLAALPFFILTLPAARSQNADHILKELVQPRPVVADADNGFLAMQKLPPRLTRDKEAERKGLLMIYPGDEQDDDAPGVNLKLLKQYQEDNVELLAAARKILAQPGWQRPRPEGRWPASLLNPYDARILFPTNVILAEAVVEAQNGRLDKAWPDILAVLKLGQRLANSGGPVIDTIGGVQLMGNAARAAAWAGQQAPDAATARRLAADLEAFEGYSDIYQRTLEGELYQALKKAEFYQAGGEEVKRELVELHVSMDELFSAQRQFNEWGSKLKDHPQQGGKLPAFKWPKYPREENLAKWLKDPPAAVVSQIESAQQMDWPEHNRETIESFNEARLVKPTSLAESLKSRRPERDLGTKEGKFSDSYDVALNQVFRAATPVRQARTSLLLRAWMYDHNGELPASLDALVPGYLSAVPVDPFDGKPMRYQKGKLWSVGEDLKDDGGDRGKDRVLPL